MMVYKPYMQTEKYMNAHREEVKTTTMLCESRQSGVLSFLVKKPHRKMPDKTIAKQMLKAGSIPEPLM